MKKSMLKLTGLLIGMTILFTGCTANNNELELVQGELETQKIENQKLIDEIEELEGRVEELEQELDRLKQDEGSNVLNIHTIDVNTSEPIILDTLEVGEESIIELLDSLASKLSESVFDNLPIVIEGIQEVDGLQIAKISLQEDEVLEVSWKQNFLQGSTGAMITQESIIKTFLQEEYQGEWIDGIEIQYEDGQNEFDHAPLIGEVIHRD